YWQQANAGEPIHIDLLPGVDGVDWLRASGRGGIPLAALLAERLPRRLAQRWCEAHALERPVAELSSRAIEQAARDLRCWAVQPTGTLGYNKAEVTLGGVDTRGLSSKTMEAATLKGLHFIGEAVDVTGHLGGFNFQWAWASGHAAGTSV